MMAKIPLPRGKGEPPVSEGVLGNLDKPESDALVALNFKVPRQFRREFKLYAAEREEDMVQVLFRAFALLKDPNTDRIPGSAIHQKETG